jgi:ABC-2 type transport system permease protein
MRALAFFKKTTLENLRDWKILSIALVFAPFFVYLMWGYFDAAAPAYRVLVASQDRDAASGRAPALAQGLIEVWRDAEHADGRPVFAITEIDDLEAAKARVKRRDADLLVEIPAGFGARLGALLAGAPGEPPRLINHGDEANVRGAMAMAMSDYVAYTYAFAITGSAPPLEVQLEQLGAQRSLSEFDLYVPAVLVLALIMIMFTAAATLIKEVDKRTMSRLMLSRLTTAELLAAVSACQVLIGVAALLLAYLAALSVGYRGVGSLSTLLVVGALSTLGVVALSVLVAAFLRSIFELLTIGCFPFFILMFFSECMFPLPKVTLFELAGNTVYANDVLPTSLTVRAFNKILNHGAGLTDVGFELAAMAVLTLAYFALGTWLFRRRHMHVA